MTNQQAFLGSVPANISYEDSIFGGATYILDVPVPVGVGYRLAADVSMTALDPTTGGILGAASLRAEAVVAQIAGGLGFTPAIAGSANPKNSANLVAVTPEVADAAFGTPTAVWTISGTNARLTVTNPAGSPDANLKVFLAVLPL